jgi:hypothetical protein
MVTVEDERAAAKVPRQGATIHCATRIDPATEAKIMSHVGKRDHDGLPMTRGKVIRIALVRGLQAMEDDPLYFA